MTVKQLIDFLKQYDPETPVVKMGYDHSYPEVDTLFSTKAERKVRRSLVRYTEPQDQAHPDNVTVIVID